MSQNHYRLLEQYYRALNLKDWASFAATLAEEVLYEVPQTRERVRGLAAYLDFNQTFPGDWTIEVVRIIADDERGCGQVNFRVDGQEMVGITFFEFQEGKIQHLTDFWPENYEPSARASRFVERY